jgi:hypothetical protein
MRRVATFLAIWLILGAQAQAEFPFPFSWLRGNDQSAAAKPTKWTGGRTSTIVTKMADAPKRLVTGTKNILTPKKTSAKSKKPTSSSGPKQHANQATEQGFLGRLFNPQPESRPATVNEWMALEKPEFGGTRAIR